MRVKKKSRETEVFDLSNWENGSVITLDEEGCKRSKFCFWVFGFFPP